MNSQHYDPVFVNVEATRGDSIVHRGTLARPRSPLDTLLATALRVTTSDPDDSISQIAVGEAIGELLALEGDRAGSWWLRGLAEGHGLFASPLAAPTPELDRQRVAGLLEAAVERSDPQRVRHIVGTNPTAVAALIAGGGLSSTSAVLVAVAAADADRAVELAALTSEPFAGWEEFVEEALGHLGSAPELRIRLLATLERWAISGTPVDESVRQVLDEVRIVGS